MIVTKLEQAIQDSALDITDPIKFAAEEYWCAMKTLDNMSVPRAKDGETLSLVGRLKSIVAQYSDEIERLQNKSDDLTQRFNGLYQCNANYSHTSNLSYKTEDKPVLIDYYVYMGNIGRYGS